MPKEKRPSFTLNAADDMFTTQAVRDERKKPKIQEIPLRAIKDFPDHPYKDKDDEDMFRLMESISENGVLTPVILRKFPGGTFEMISGHRRKIECELLGIPTIRAEILDLDRDQAIIMMCDSNLQRTTILPSEKAFAYKHSAATRMILGSCIGYIYTTFKRGIFSFACIPINLFFRYLYVKFLLETHPTSCIF